MREELKKRLQEVLDSRLRDFLFEEIGTAQKIIMESTVRSVLQSFDIYNAKIIATNETEPTIIVTFDGRSYECKVVARSAPFEELIPEVK